MACSAAARTAACDRRCLPAEPRPDHFNERMTTMRTFLLPLVVAAAPAFAHVTLPPGGAAAGSDYEAAFRVGHACEGAPATTAITVRLPEGFTLAEAQPRAGWTLASSPREVRWTAEAGKGLPGKE